MSYQLDTLPVMKPFRRKLRKQMTAAEVALWLMIKNKQLDGERFLRQFSIGHYVVDFYCHKHKLAIELDGEVHSSEDRQTYDKKRTDYLNSVGVTVLRFENFEVLQYPTRTLDEIRKYLKLLSAWFLILPNPSASLVPLQRGQTSRCWIYQK